jgi:hypothetical protein
VKYDGTGAYTFKKGNALLNGCLTISTGADDVLYAFENGGNVTISSTTGVKMSVPGLTFASGVQPNLVLSKGTAYSGDYVETPTAANANLSFAWNLDALNTMNEIYVALGIDAKLADIKLLTNAVVFGGKATIGVGDILNIGGITVDRLQFGRNNSNSDFSYEGFKGSGNVGFSGTLGDFIDLGSLSADVDTFARTYEFEGEISLGVFEFEGELVLLPVQNMLVPNKIRVNINVEPGIPIIPIAPIGYLTGGGGGVEGLADTLNGMYSGSTTIPPLKLSVEANLDLLKVFQFKPIRLTAGPTQVSLDGIPEIGIPGTDKSIAPFTKFYMGYYLTEGRFPISNNSLTLAQGYQMKLEAAVELVLVEALEIFRGGGVLNLSAIMTNYQTMPYFKFTGQLYCTVQIPKLFNYGPNGKWSIGPETFLKADVGVSETKVWFATQILWWAVTASYIWGDEGPDVSWIKTSSIPEDENAFTVTETIHDADGNAASEVTYFENMRSLASTYAESTPFRAFADSVSIEDISDGAKTKYRITIPDGVENTTVFTSAPRTDLKILDGSGDLFPLVYSKPIEDRGKPHTQEQLSQPGINAIDYSLADEEGHVKNTIWLHLVPTAANDTWTIESSEAFDCEIVEILPPAGISNVSYNDTSKTVTWNVEELKANETYTAEVYISADGELVREDRSVGHFVGSADANAGTYTIDPDDIPNYATSGTYYVWVYLIGSKGEGDSADSTNYGASVAQDGVLVFANAKTPAPVTDLVVANGGNGTVKATWTPLAGDGIGYIIYPLDDATGDYIYQESETEGTVLVSYDVPYALKDKVAAGVALPGLTPGKTYKFKISAYYSDGESSPVFGSEATSAALALPIPQPPKMSAAFSKGTVIPASEDSVATLQTNGEFDLTVSTDVASDYSVAVNGVEKFTSQGVTTATYTIDLGELSSAILDIKATNAAGDTTVQSFMLQIDDIAPTLFLETGEDGIIIADENGHFSVNGYTEAGTLITVQGSNHESGYAGNDGAFAVASSLGLSTAGGELLDVIAKDGSGNVTTATLRVLGIDEISSAIEKITILPYGTITMQVNETVTVEATGYVGSATYKLNGSALVYEITSGDSVAIDPATGILTAMKEGTAKVVVKLTKPDGTVLTSDVLTINVGNVTPPPSGGGGGSGSASPAPASDPANEPEDGTETTLKPWTDPFTDVKSGAWYYDDVKFVYQHGLFEGTSATAFSPDISMTRGMLVTVLGRYYGVDVNKYTGSSFDDVDGSQYYAAYIEWAKENGIVSGYGLPAGQAGGGKFGPNDDITREQMAAILKRFADFAGITLPETRAYAPFVDDADISVYAKDAVAAMFEAGIVSGKPGNLVDPKGSATRAEVAAMLHRFIEAAE